MTSPVAAPTDREVELKLGLSVDALTQLRAGLFAAAPAGRITSIYFDTPDQALWRAGFCLRLRHTPGGWVQTAKGPAAGIARWEDEAPLARGVLDRGRLADGPLAQIIAAQPLAPVFETQVRRRVLDVEVPGGTFEMALDEGDIIAGMRRATLAELELELRTGPPKILFAQSRKLAREGGLRPCLASKAERGYALASGPSPQSVGFLAPALRPDMTALTGLEALALAGLRHLEANADLVREGAGPAAVHQTRVALRRLRVFLAAFEPVIGERRRASLDGRLKALTERFADARELDVLGPPLLAAFQGGADERRAFEIALEQARLRARRKAAASLRTVGYAALLLDALEWTTQARAGLSAAQARETLSDLAGRTLSHHRKRLRRRADALHWRDPAARHRMRISAKRLRYLAEVFAPLFGDADDFLADLKRFLDLAGDLNDIAAAPDAVRANLGAALPAPAAFSAGLTLGARRAETGRLLRKARKAWRDVESRKPFWR